MRKLLMASAAILGISMSLGVADAAQVYVSSPTSPGITGFFGGSTKVQPGQIAVRIDLLEAVYGVSGWGTTDSVNGNKVQPYGIIGYPRLYMGVDAMATNGIKYGLFWEIRNNNSSGFPASGTAGNPGTSGNSTGGTLFWRRDYLYIGTDQLGIVRLGQTDGPMSSFLTATFDDIATGLWNGDINDWSNGASYGLTGSFPNWPFMDVGAEYTSAKIVYLSPNFSGFDFQASYEPSSANLTDTQNCNNASGGGFINCNNQSTSTAANDLQRRRNTLEAGIRYRGAFDGVGIGASLVGAYGGHVLPSANNPGVGGATFTDIHGNTIVLHPTTSFDNLAMGYFGANVTYLGVTVGGSIIGGQYNGQMAALPSNGTNSLAWILGAEYTVGPFTIGGSYYKWKYQGYWTLPGAETDQGLGIGASYNLAPGMQLLAEYLYGQRYRGNFDFSQGAPGPHFNNVHTQIIGAGIKIRW